MRLRVDSIECGCLLRHFLRHFFATVGALPGNRLLEVLVGRLEIVSVEPAKRRLTGAYLYQRRPHRNVRQNCSHNLVRSAKISACDHLLQR